MTGSSSPIDGELMANAKVRKLTFTGSTQEGNGFDDDGSLTSYVVFHLAENPQQRLKKIDQGSLEFLCYKRHLNVQAPTSSNLNM